MLRPIADLAAGLWESVTSYPLVFYPSFVFGVSFLITLIPVEAVQFRPGFYSAVAQLLPVLLVAMFAELVLEAREFRKDAESDDRAAREKDEGKPTDMEKERFQRAAAVIATLIIGEVAALWSLGTEPGWPYLAALCCVSSVVATAALLGPFMHRLTPGGPRSPYRW